MSAALVRLGHQPLKAWRSLRPAGSWLSKVLCVKVTGIALVGTACCSDRLPELAAVAAPGAGQEAGERFVAACACGAALSAAQSCNAPHAQPVTASNKEVGKQCTSPLPSCDRQAAQRQLSPPWAARAR